MEQLNVTLEINNAQANSTWELNLSEGRLGGMVHIAPKGKRPFTISPLRGVTEFPPMGSPDPIIVKINDQFINPFGVVATLHLNADLKSGTGTYNVYSGATLDLSVPNTAVTITRR